MDCGLGYAVFENEKIRGHEVPRDGQLQLPKGLCKEIKRPMPRLSWVHLGEWLPSPSGCCSESTAEWQAGTPSPFLACLSFDLYSRGKK
jgi:hypothetical protein